MDRAVGAKGNEGREELGPDGASRSRTAGGPGAVGGDTYTEGDGGSETVMVGSPSMVIPSATVAAAAGRRLSESKASTGPIVLVEGIAMLIVIMTLAASTATVIRE